MKLNKNLKKIILIIGIPIFLILFSVGGILLFITLVEYRPLPVEEVKVEGEFYKKLSLDDEIHLLSWNIGYFALGEQADFFMDGGKMVRGFSEKDIRINLSNVVREVNQKKPDIILFQEVDKKAYRSFGVDEVAELSFAFPSYKNSYARNFKALFIPYPFPPIRNVDAGLLNLSSFNVTKAERRSLPSPFKWPVKTVNLKRCLLVNRLPIERSEKELVIANLHLEAYDESGGALAQLQEMLQYLNEEYEKGNYVIAGGDFNQTFSSVDNERFLVHEKGIWKPSQIKIDSYEHFVFLMDGETPSCRSLHKPYDRSEKFPYYIIDGYIVSENIEVKELKTINLDFKHSDHNPVSLRVRLK